MIFEKVAGKCGVGRFALALAVSLAATSRCGAVNVAWVLDKTTTAPELTLDGAGDWFDDNNWTNGFPANAVGHFAYFSRTGENWSGGVRYTKLTAPVTVSGLFRRYKNTQSNATFDNNRRVIIGGDNEITLSNPDSAAFITGLMLYAPVRVTQSKSQPELFSAQLCGPFVNESGLTPKFVPFGQRIKTRFRRDLWADSTAEGITNIAPTSFTMDEMVDMHIYAPRGTDGSSGTWRITEGSNRLVAVGDANDVAVGSAVTCAGYIPAGAYVRNIYPDGSIAISANAEATSGEGGVTVTFGAFHPHMYQRLDSIVTPYHNSSYICGIWPMKYAEEDDFTFEAFNFPSGSSVYSFNIDTEDGFVPARFILHNTSQALRPLLLSECDVEFAAPTNGTACGYPNTVKMYKQTLEGFGVERAVPTARITVAEGLNATFGLLTNVIGRLVKKGGGSLATPVSSGDVSGVENGAIVVEEGSLVLSGEGTEPYEIGTLAVTNGATLTIPACGLRCFAFAAEPGATINGTGTLSLPVGADISGVTFGEGVFVVRNIPAENFVAERDFIRSPTVEAGVPGNPAIWYDASKEETFGFVPEDQAQANSGNLSAGRGIWKWRDVRGEEYAYCTTLTNATAAWRSNTLVTNEFGNPVLVYIGPASSSAAANRYDFTFNRKIFGIRSIFKVMYPVLGGGPILGGSNLPHSGGNDSAGTRVPTYLASLFTNLPAAYESVPVYMNGEARDWHKGYPYRGGSRGSSNTIASPINRLVPLVLEFHLPDDAVYANSFGYIRKFDNGGDLISEVIVYTNELSVADRLKVRKYLMEKWLAAELNAEPGEGREMPAQAYAAGEGAYVPTGKAAFLKGISSDGAFLKYGHGSMHVDDLSCATMSIRVAEGLFSVNSFSVPTLSTLPGDPHIHVDAEDSAAFTYVSGNRVSAWADVRRGDHAGASAVNPNESYAPTRVEVEALGGKHVVDTGAHRYRGSANVIYSGALSYETTYDAHTVLSVLGTAGGGGPLIGWTDTTTSYNTGYKMRGLMRNFTNTEGQYSLPMVASNLYEHTYCAALDNRAGGARMRLNGTDVEGGVTGFTGGYDLVSFADYDRIGASGFGQVTSGSNIQNGGQQIAESIVYTNVLSRDSVRKVEAYLNKKWFGRDTPGCRAARFGALAVDEGAVFEVVGDLPAYVNGLAVYGSVTGAVSVADGGTIEVNVAAGGLVEPMAISGGVTLEGGGTVHLSGDVRNVPVGRYPLVALNAPLAGLWTVTGGDSRRPARLVVAGGVLTLEVLPKGMMFILR